MVNKYNIKVINKSGAQQQYALFNKPPIVTGRVQGQIWSNVFAKGNTPKGSSANFTVYNQYYAVVGTSNGAPNVGVEVNVTGDREVQLGTTNPNGTAVPGTTLQLLVSEDAPQFSDNPLPNGSYPNAFEIQTGNDFTLQQATKGRYVIGLGGSKSGNGVDGPAATFVPEPGVRYQIQPLNTYYLAVGDFSKGSLIDVTKIGSTTVAVDFATSPTDDVVIVHDDHGNLNIQAA
ncbi:hypothetical protein EDB81DRAFT_934207 [Dactylonectria macrodidyma]|uniref:Uncharacterized protein n=1 Tax=Dactylonectria macrodidyma TaxID=307937 RepID=A0A9P9EVB8_9HYPO|nr:hypothetical protein EDB81DRAFT_934207 [Dactylonectria macrodidyma]